MMVKKSNAESIHFFQGFFLFFQNLKMPLKLISTKAGLYPMPFSNIQGLSFAVSFEFVYVTGNDNKF